MLPFASHPPIKEHPLFVGSVLGWGSHQLQGSPVWGHSPPPFCEHLRVPTRAVCFFFGILEGITAAKIQHGGKAGAQHPFSRPILGVLKQKSRAPLLPTKLCPRGCSGRFSPPLVGLRMHRTSLTFSHGAAVGLGEISPTGKARGSSRVPGRGEVRNFSWANKRERRGAREKGKGGGDRKKKKKKKKRVGRGGGEKAAAEERQKIPQSSEPV